MARWMPDARGRDIVGIMIQMAVHAGFPLRAMAFYEANKVFAERDASGEQN